MFPWDLVLIYPKVGRYTRYSKTQTCMYNVGILLNRPLISQLKIYVSNKNVSLLLSLVDIKK